tara:strand:+ start:49 stop:444 length:396 start_codon:yes stop_codon:yes gene_type:complete
MTQLWNSTSTIQNEAEWFPFRYDSCTAESFEIKTAGNDLNITMKNIPTNGKFTYLLYRPGTDRTENVVQGVAKVEANGEAKLSLPKLNKYEDNMRSFPESFVYRIVADGYISQVYRKYLENIDFNTVFHNF